MEGREKGGKGGRWKEGRLEGRKVEGREAGRNFKEGRKTGRKLEENGKLMEGISPKIQGSIERKEGRTLK